MVSTILKDLSFALVKIMLVLAFAIVKVVVMLKAVNFIFSFSVPQLWKDSISLENITNDFLESNVTGEVMNLDDFLKELQVNELAQQTEELQRHVQTPNHLAQMPHNTSPPNHRMGHMQQEDTRFQPLIRPANIETLKEPSHPVRPSIMHHVGKPPDLHMMQSTSHMDPMGENPVSLPHRESMQQQGGKEHGGHGIPQASVRPLVRPVIMSAGKQEHSDHNRMDDSKPPASSKTKAKSVRKGIYLSFFSLSYFI